MTFLTKKRRDLSFKNGMSHVLVLRRQLYQDFILKAGDFVLLLGNCLKRVHFKFEVKRVKHTKVRGKYEILGRQLLSRGEVYQHSILKGGDFVLSDNCEKRVQFKFEVKRLQRAKVRGKKCNFGRCAIHFGLFFLGFENRSQRWLTVWTPFLHTL